MKRSKSNDSSKSKPKRTKKARVSNPSDGIDKSQRLLRSSRKKPCAREKQSLDKKNTLGLVCGKPMPPLSELEKMYEGSDDEMPEATPVASSVNIETPEAKSTPASNGPITPTTAKKYADEILKILNGQDAPQPIIPMKKYKRPEVPYIVGCTERPRIPENPNCNVFKGDDYGITSKTNNFGENEDEDCLNTPGFYLNGYTLSKSIFNAKANEIASKLLSNENNPVIGSSDSDDTVVYELNSPKNRFSPEPSTSKDNETILKNDLKFIESFVAPDKSNSEMDNKLEPFSENMVIEDGIIHTDDNMKNPSNSEMVNLNPESSAQAKQKVLELVKNNDDDIEIIEQPCETIEINDDEMYNIGVKPCTHIKSENNKNNNSDIIILDDIEITDTNKTNANMKRSNQIKGENTDNSPIVVDDDYNPFDPTIIDEIDLTNVSVDDVISENQSIIDKYSKRNTLSTVKVVDANVVRPISVKNTNENVTNMQFGSRNKQTGIIQTPNNQHHSNANCNPNALEKIIKEFFDKWGNTSLSHNQASRPISLSSHERIFPKCSLNTNSNIPIQRIFPHSVNICSNRPIQKIMPQSSLNNSSNRPDQRIIPQSSLNNSSNRPDQRIIPQSSLNNSSNRPDQRIIPQSSLNNSSNRPDQRIIPQSSLNNSSNKPDQRIIPQSSLNNSSNRPDQRIIPQSSLNNSSNRPDQRITPQSSLNNSPNKPTQSKNKRQKKDKNINISPNNNNVETPTPTPLFVGTICPICLDELTRETVGSTNCGHLFCLPCITTALKTKPKRCPTCRKKLTGLGYHQIFM